MTQYRDKMAGSHFHVDKMAGFHFHTWTETAPTHGRPDWVDALRRYASTVDRTTGSGRE